METTVSDPLVGRLLDGRYRVGERIARGGMATVYQGTDTRLDREVALKVMHPGFAEDHAFVERFVREARVAARVSHPNVVSVFDQGDDDGLVFLAMEYVHGRTLRDLLRERGRFGAAEALDLMQPVLAGLAAAHDAGLVHRDIKPENVLIADDGRIKVADFGLSRAASTASAQSTQGVLIGTVAYLSPEQVERGTADMRSDVYAAGVLLFELLTGSTPYAGESPLAVAYQHVNGQVPAPSTLAPGTPPAVDALVLAATQRDPGRRPANAAAFLADVRRVRRDLPEVADPVADLGHQTLVVALPGTAAAARRPGQAAKPGKPPKEPKAPRKRRRKGPILLALLLVLAVAAGGTGWWFGSGRYTPVPSVLGQDQPTAEATLATADLKAAVAESVYSEDVPAGLVISTDPEPTVDARRGSTVDLVLSLGPERYAVPELANLTADEAKAALEGTKLALGPVAEEYSETVEVGRIIRFDPPVGTSSKPQTPVSVWVSKGPAPVPVPKIVGASTADAQKALKSVGLSGKEVGREFSETAPKGVVIRSDPAPDTVVNKGTEVKYVVSDGPPPVPVPNVTDKKLSDAEKILTDAGFKVSVNKPPVVILNRVISQSPGGGNTAPRGSTVTITVI